MFCKSISTCLIVMVLNQYYVSCVPLAASGDTGPVNPSNSLTFNRNVGAQPSQFNPNNPNNPNNPSLSQRNNYYDSMHAAPRFAPSNFGQYYPQPLQPHFNAPQSPYQFANGMYPNGLGGGQIFYPDYRQPGAYGSGFSYGNNQLAPLPGYQPHQSFGLGPLPSAYSRSLMNQHKPEELDKKQPQ